MDEEVEGCKSADPCPSHLSSPLLQIYLERRLLVGTKRATKRVIETIAKKHRVKPLPSYIPGLRVSQVVLQLIVG